MVRYLATYLLLDFRYQRSIIGLPGTTTILPGCVTVQLDGQVRARYTKDVTDLFHWSPPGNKGERAIHFFARPYTLDFDRKIPPMNCKEQII